MHESRSQRPDGMRGARENVPVNKAAWQVQLMWCHEGWNGVESAWKVVRWRCKMPRQNLSGDVAQYHRNSRRALRPDAVDVGRSDLCLNDARC